MADVRMLTEEPDQRHVLRRAWPHLRRHRAAMAGAVAVNLLATLALTLVPVAVGRAVDAVLDSDRQGLIAYAAMVFVLVVARTVLLRQSELLLTRVGERVVHDLRDLVVERLGGTPLRFLEAHRGGDLLQRATVEIAELATFVRGQLPDLISLAGYVVFATVVLLTSSWQLFLLLVLVFVPPMWLLARIVRRAAERAYPAEAAARSTLTSTFSESLLAREQLQIDGATGTWLSRLRGDADGYYRRARAAQGAATWIDGTWIVQGITSAAMLVAGGVLAVNGHVTVGVVVTFVLASRDLFSSVDDLTLVVGDLLETRVGLARLLDLLAATSPGSRAVPGKRPENAGLTAESVTYSYNAGEPVLHGVSVHFAPGEHAGLAGETGSGKTTLAKLLCGLYLPDSGVVRLGGVDLAELDATELRRRLVLIPQQVHMIAGTLADNLALTPGTKTRDDFAAAAAALGLSAWIDTLPDGFDTDLGRRGERFSAGERQLVGLIRAAMTDPEVLILDEATADLDPATAERIEEALARLRDGRTVLVIAHRPATIARLPRVIRLHAGSITTEEPCP
ncbi:multidrug ABC transporter permease [Actinoplanes cyaneus]|uniref:Multidrug ABC transporter permease n=1 Tax=Actinoplanes cyaneus TaxID=52696 RepID=A0A919M7F4_9ACTN|nr:ABC transporter ATP-binding protein [Actinoplanes cyaneus]MCW2142553.1 ABC-type multidrug transport system, ATPase and permease component [Actinoplanes cyaneus]GID65359.1 multidrug ABC transporter permease [Actinoplanes cyaneus]